MFPFMNGSSVVRPVALTFVNGSYVPARLRRARNVAGFASRGGPRCQSEICNSEVARSGSRRIIAVYRRIVSFFISH